MSLVWNRERLADREPMVFVVLRVATTTAVGEVITHDKQLTTLRKDDSPMNSRCEAKKRDGALCQKYPVKGRGRCRLHGGKSLRGIAHPGYSSGKYVRNLPPRLQAEYVKQTQAYEAVLLSNQHEIQLIDLQLSEWAASLQDQADNTDSWAKILVAIEARRRLTESESKYLELAGRTVSKADAIVFLGQAVNSIKTAVHAHVSDGDIAKRIFRSVSESIAQLTHSIDRHQSQR